MCDSDRCDSDRQGNWLALKCYNFTVALACRRTRAETGKNSSIFQYLSVCLFFEITVKYRAFDPLAQPLNNG